MRPIDADKFKSHLEKAMEKMHLIHGVKGVDVGAVIKALEMQPTVDVVTREEVERIKREIFECIEPSFAIGEFTGSDVFFAIRAEDYNRCRKKYKEDGK